MTSTKNRTRIGGSRRIATDQTWRGSAAAEATRLVRGTLEVRRHPRPSQLPTSAPLFDNSALHLIRGDPLRSVEIRAPSFVELMATVNQGSTTRRIEIRCLVAEGKQGVATRECRGTLDARATLLCAL